MMRFTVCVLSLLLTLSTASAGVVRTAKVKQGKNVVLSDDVKGRQAALDLGYSYLDGDVCKTPYISDKKVKKGQGTKRVTYIVRFKPRTQSSGTTFVSFRAGASSGYYGYGYRGAYASYRRPTVMVPSSVTRPCIKHASSPRSSPLALPGQPPPPDDPNSARNALEGRLAADRGVIDGEKRNAARIAALERAHRDEVEALQADAAAKAQEAAELEALLSEVLDKVEADKTDDEDE